MNLLDPKNKKKIDQSDSSTKNILTDVKYLCRSNSIIRDALRNGQDVTQMPNGDVIITEVKTVHIQFSYDETKDRMIKIQNPKIGNIL